MKRIIANISEITTTSEKIQRQYFTQFMALSDIVTRCANTAFRHEVNWLRLRTLIVIALRGKGVTSASELSKILLRPNQNVATLVDDLERSGYVVKLREPGDRRVITVKITRRGLKHIQELLEKIVIAEYELNQCLTKSELKSIGNMMAKVRNHLVRLLMENSRHFVDYKNTKTLPKKTGKRKRTTKQCEAAEQSGR